MFFSTATSAFATEIPPDMPEINKQEVLLSGETFTLIEEMENATYYIEKTDSYNIAVGLYDTFADCSIYYHEADTLYTKIVPIEEINSVIPQTRSASTQAAQFESIADAILDGSISLSQLTLQAPQIMPRVTSSERTKIMNELYDAGWPTSYVNFERDRMTQNGVTAILYHSVTYSIQDYDYTFLAAKTALSVLLALTGLPTAKIKLIATLYLTADGIWQTVSDMTAGRFDVYAYGTKQVKIGNVQPYWAGRTVKWTGYTFDIGAGLNFDYENKHSDYDNNTLLLQTGLNNYFNMM